jgi:hypothetical protein
MQQRFASEKTHVTDAAVAENLERGSEPVRIHPAQIGHTSPGEVAEITAGIARVCNRDIAQPWAAATNHAQHIPNLRQFFGHISPQGNRTAAPSGLPAIRFGNGQQVCTECY